MYTEQEILQQSEVLLSVVQQMDSELEGIMPRISHLQGFDEVLFVGCGSSFYIAHAAAAYSIRVLKHPARALVSSEILLSPDSCLVKNHRNVAVVFSRSGETTEVLLAARRLKQDYAAEIIGITCTQGSELSKISDIPIVLGVTEKSVVMTKSFSSMLLAANMLINTLGTVYNRAMNEYADKIPSLIGESEKLFASLQLNRFEHVVFLGVGEYLGVSMEGALKSKEMACFHTEAYSMLDYRHGPKALASSKTLVVIQNSSSIQTEVKKLLEELKGYGATIITIGTTDSDISLDFTRQGEDSFVRVIPLQVLALKLSVLRGFDPDKPKNLTKVVSLD